MNLKLSDERLRKICGELLAEDPTLSGRKLRAALKVRFGVVCRTDRVYAAWRSLRAEPMRVREESASTEPHEWPQLLEEARQQIHDLETALIDAQQRAVLAEQRERVHQERWAREIEQWRAAATQRR